MRRGLYRHARNWGGEGALTSRCPLSYCGDPQSSDRWGWCVGDLDAHCVVDWISTDGTSPRVGGTLTEHGDPTAGQPSPWRLGSGDAITGTEFDGVGDSFSSAVDIDPGADDDFVVLVLGQMSPEMEDSEVVLATRIGSGRGVSIAKSTTGLRMVIQGDAVTQISCSLDQTPLGCVALILGVIDHSDASTGSKLYLNGVSVGTTIVPAGVLGTGSGFGIGGDPDQTGTRDLTGRIYRTMVFKGVGVADLFTATKVQKIAAAALGIHDVEASSPTTFGRASPATWKIEGRYYLASHHLPRAGHAQGLLGVFANRPNLCFRNVNPADTTGWTATDGTFAAVDDSAALLTAKAEVFGPNVFELINGTASDQYVYGGTPTGSTDPHSLSVLARIVAGSGAEIGLRDVSAETFVKAADISDDYARTKGKNATPADTDVQFCILVSPGCTLRFIAQQLEADTTCSPIVPTWATDAGATALIDDLRPPVTLDDGGGWVECYLRPEGWSGGEISEAQRDIFDRGSGYLVSFVPGSNSLRAFDGTTMLLVPGPFVDGVEVKISYGWGSRQVLIGGSVYDIGAYDGTLFGDGALSLLPPIAWARDFRHRRESA